ncbi:hypothetical protein WICANDRAFT_86487, partial [Wickerhamomyces anomalus NRRL Y-366-8]
FGVKNAQQRLIQATWSLNNALIFYHYHYRPNNNFIVSSGSPYIYWKPVFMAK